MNDLLQTPDTAHFLKGFVSAKKADDVFNTIEAIPYGIPDDGWTEHTMHVHPTGQDRAPHTGILICRDAEKCIRFLLGLRQLASEMTWAAVRQMREECGEEDDEAPPTRTRLFNELHTGDWWWETQRALPERSTVVPVLFASDKTQMSKLHGDVIGYPFYITIGNLSRKARRMQRAPTVILLGMIPVIKAHKDDYDRALKSQLYHQCMRIMLRREYYYVQVSASG